MLFNLIISNSDAHGKNISFFIGKSGLIITPCYDLVSVVFEATQQHKLDTQLAMAITKALAQLVDSRCDALLEQSRQFKAVILSAFS